MSAPIDIYVWATPNSWKITIALEEMALPYNVRPVAIVKGEQFKPEFLAISPNNRIPAIVDPDGPDGAPVSVFESGAILSYLGRKTGKFYPADERGRTEVEQWLFWQMAGVGPMFGQASHFRNYAPTLVDDPIKIDYSAKRYDNEVSRLLGVLDARLSGCSFVAGDYSIADMAIYPWVGYAGHLGQDLDAFPRVQAWLKRVGTRPAVVRGMAVGADLPRSSPPAGSEEHREFAKALFGQNAQTVVAARQQSPQT
ncbi:MAG: glutathione S-transferase N-terminal domain-containing protein [Pseudorhodoplanes sp.]|jgi:glutathione S-transferase/GST-like protein|nr:glutathione S-transferase N-terminal domain-containing protein [Pseudorhodoplanes sp.]